MMLDALPVWAGVDIGGSHIGLSFFISSLSSRDSSGRKVSEQCSDVYDSNLQVISLPPGIEKILNNTTLWYEYDGQKMIDCVIGTNMIHMKLKNLSTTAEQLLQYVYILISRVIDAQESLVRDSLEKLYWDLKGVGIGCPGNIIFYSFFLCVVYDDMMRRNAFNFRRYICKFVDMYL